MELIGLIIAFFLPIGGIQELFTETLVLLQVNIHWLLETQIITNKVKRGHSNALRVQLLLSRRIDLAEEISFHDVSYVTTLQDVFEQVYFNFCKSVFIFVTIVWSYYYSILMDQAGVFDICGHEENVFERPPFHEYFFIPANNLLRLLNNAVLLCQYNIKELPA
jgi:hypothetical protein